MNAVTGTAFRRNYEANALHCDANKIFRNLQRFVLKALRNAEPFIALRLLFYPTRSSVIERYARPPAAHLAVRCAAPCQRRCRLTSDHERKIGPQMSPDWVDDFLTLLFRVKSRAVVGKIRGQKSRFGREPSCCVIGLGAQMRFLSGRNAASP